MGDRELVSINNKDFIVQDGIVVNGTATFNSDIVLNTVPLSVNAQTNRLQAFVDNAWVEIAFLSDTGLTDLSALNIQFNYQGEQI